MADPYNIANTVGQWLSMFPSSITTCRNIYGSVGQWLGMFPSSIATCRNMQVIAGLWLGMIPPSITTCRNMHVGQCVPSINNNIYRNMQGIVGQCVPHSISLSLQKYMTQVALWGVASMNNNMSKYMGQCCQWLSMFPPSMSKYAWQCWPVCSLPFSCTTLCYKYNYPVSCLQWHDRYSRIPHSHLFIVGMFAKRFSQTAQQGMANDMILTNIATMG